MLEFGAYAKYFTVGVWCGSQITACDPWPADSLSSLAAGTFGLLSPLLDF